MYEIDKELLEKEYIENKKTIKQISLEYNVTNSRVSYLLKRYRIRKLPITKDRISDEELLYEYNILGKSASAISKKYQIHSYSLGQRLRRLGQQTRSREDYHVSIIIGETYGYLTVLSKTDHKSKQSKAIFWECQCICGKILYVIGSSLANGNQKSCGCKRYLCGSENPGWKGAGEIGPTYWRRIKHEAIKRNIEFSLTAEEGWALFLKQDKKCAITGQEIIIPNKKQNKKLGIKKSDLASLDRIDSTKGYIKDNVQWVTQQVNFMKYSYSQQEFIRMCGLIWNRNKHLIE